MLPPRLAGLAAILLALAGGCGSATDDRPPKWSFISATIIEPSCATVNCHSAITHQGGRRSLGARDRLPDAGQRPVRHRHNGDPATSALVTLLNAVGLDPHAARQSAPRSRHPADRRLDQPRRARQLTLTRRPTFDMNMRRLLFCALMAGLLLAALGGRASAYPQFQFSSGTTRCSQCHYSPAGGGLITSWGRDEAGDTISLGRRRRVFARPLGAALVAGARRRRPTGGAGQRLGRLRVARVRLLPDAGRRLRALRLRRAGVALPRGGDPRRRRPRRDASTVGLGSVGDRFISNEHYLMWRPSATGPYARVGRFFAPFGLRFVEHIFYVQRYTGLRPLQRDVQRLGRVRRRRLGAARHRSSRRRPTSFPDALQSVAPASLRQSGLAAYGEKRFNGMAMLALQARIGIASEASRYTGAPSASCGSRTAKMLALGEADFVRQIVSVGSGTVGQNQFVSYLGATFFPTRGLMAGRCLRAVPGGSGRRGDRAQRLRRRGKLLPLGPLRAAGARSVSVHRLRARRPDEASASLFMLQLHYYL